MFGINSQNLFSCTEIAGEPREKGILPTEPYYTAEQGQKQGPGFSRKTPWPHSLAVWIVSLAVTITDTNRCLSYINEYVGYNFSKHAVSRKKSGCFYTRILDGDGNISCWLGYIYNSFLLVAVMPFWCSQYNTATKTATGYGSRWCPCKVGTQRRQNRDRRCSRSCCRFACVVICVPLAIHAFLLIR